MILSPELKEALDKTPALRTLKDMLIVKVPKPNSINYIDIAHDNHKMLSWAKPSNIEHRQNGNWNHDIWHKDYRVMGKPGKLFKRLLPELTPSAIGSLVQEYYASNCINIDIKIVKGDDIRYYYHKDQTDYDFRGGIGPLDDSCMRYDKCQDFFGVYTDNPNVVRMAIAISPDNSEKIIGRALVWQTNKGVLMDRIYGNPTTVECFKQYAVEKGMMYKTRQSYDYKRSVTMLDGRRVDMGLEVELDNGDFDQYPYLDTFTYLNDDRTTLYNSGYDLTSYYELTSTEGYLEDDEDMVITEDTGDRIHIDNAYYCEGFDGYWEYAVYCDHSGDYVPSEYAVTLHDGESAWEDDDDLIQLHHHGEYALLSDSNLVELHTGEYALSDDDDVVELHTGEYALMDYDNLVELHDGDYALLGDSDVIELHDGEWALKSDLIELHDGEWALKSDSDVVELHTGNKYALTDDDNLVELYNGDYALMNYDHVVELQDGDYALLGDSDLVLENGEWIIKD